MLEWAGRRVLVTGGSGVIGVELLHLLAERGADVLSLDRQPLPAWAPRSVRSQLLELADGDLAGIADFAPRTVFHLAASFERSVETAEFWDDNWRDNGLAAHRSVELGRLPSVEELVFASSYLIYDPALYTSPRPRPRSRAVALTETSAQRPRNLCGHAKLYTEGELAFLSDLVRPELRTVSARIFRVYGRGSRDVVSRWVRAALAGGERLVYHPQNQFDYVYAGDVAEGLLRLAERPDARGVVNLGSGHARTVEELSDLVSAAVPEAPVPRLRPRAEEPYEASQADLGRLADLTGWKPATTLEAGVERLVRFYGGSGGDPGDAPGTRG